MARPHPTDLIVAAEIARAVSYAAHFRKGPFEVHRARAATLEAALIEAARMNATHGQHGRRAIVYAITPEGASYPIPADR